MAPVPAAAGLRARYFAALLAVICMGLATRLSHGPLADSIGDALWTVMIYLLVRITFPAVPMGRAFVAAAAISWAVEFQQLYRAEWILKLRATTIGHLILGSDFDWRDLPSYLMGAACALALDRYSTRSR
jgi:hypothetical protein